MGSPVVVDTNVLIVANGRDVEQAAPSCVRKCAEELRTITDGGILVLDSGMEILREYRRKVNQSGSPGIGDGFLKWALTNLANASRCHRVAITPNAARGYDEFPEDPDLTTFDRSDRKFVAVARAHPGRPTILNATDSDWANANAALVRHGVLVQELCP